MKALIFVLLLGAGIGLLWPTGGTDAPAAPGAAAEAPAPRPGEAKAPAPATFASAALKPSETLLERSAGGHFYVDAEVNGQLVHFVVDTGATSVALTVDDARRIGLPVSTGEFQIVGTGASGPVRGQSIMLDRVSVGGKEVRGVSGAVLEGLGVSLLGQSYLSRISSVEMSGDHMRLQ
jgi:aspartyl protease family protein